MISEVRSRLYQLAEEDYKEFSKKLIPGAGNIIGIRLPVLRKMAREIATLNYQKYLEEADSEITSESAHEEIMLQGLVIGYVMASREERSVFLDQFIPKITNWAICDSCVCGYKFMEKDRTYWFDYLMRYRASRGEYEQRFVIVSLLSHFMNIDYIDRILEFCNGFEHGGYYAQMGAAWAIQVCYVNFPEKTVKLLKDNKMDDFIQNKAIQKIRESYRVSKDKKEELAALRRR